MKNILVVIDGLNFSESQLDPILYISRLMNGRLTIALLEIIPPPAPILFPAIQDAMFYSQRSTEDHILERHRQIVKNTEKLRAAFVNRGIDITLHTYTEAPLESVIRESRFADVLLVLHSLSFSAVIDSDPPNFIQELLLKAQCPVLTLPGMMQVIKEVVLTYNGTYSSMYAIRTFLQLFPTLALRKVKVVYVVENGIERIPDETLLRHYLGGICTKIEYVILKGDPSQNLLIRLQYSKHTLATFGAYGRSRVSRFFNSSTVDDTLRLNHIYTFITHP